MSNKKDIETYPDPPEHLSEKSKTLWHELVGKRIRSIERITMFQVALETLDVVDELRAERQKEGLVSHSKRSGLSHINTIIKLEKDHRKIFMSLWTRLGLTWDGFIETIELK